jgi:hypothetical protein
VIPLIGADFAPALPQIVLEGAVASIEPDLNSP